MSESNFSRDAVARVLQVTRTLWLQTPAKPSATHRAHTPSSRPLSSHRIAAQTKATRRRATWSWPVTTHQLHQPQA